MEYIASAFIPAAILLCAAMLTFSKKATFDDFLRGTEDGIKIIFRLLPTLIVLVVSVSMLSASGAIDFLSSLLSPLFEKLGIPTGMLPLIIMRPFSGSGSNAMIADIFDKYGAEGALVAWYSGEQNAKRWVDGEADAIGENGQHYSWDAKQGNGDEPSIREYVNM